MLGALLPEHVATAESFGDLQGATVLPEEEPLVTGATPRRVREFATTRACARQALRDLGLGSGPLLRGPGGAPCWPTGVVGSLTHCEGYRGAAAAFAGRVRSIGIDAEPHLALPEGVAPLIASTEEVRALDGLRTADPNVCWDRLLFCVKEAVYKAWFPLTGRWLRFGEVQISLGRGGTFGAALVDGDDPSVRVVDRIRGRWSTSGGLVLATAYVPAEPDQRLDHHGGALDREEVVALEGAPAEPAGGVAGPA